MNESLNRSAAQRISFEAGGRQLEGSLLVPENAQDSNVLFIRGGAVTYPAVRTFTEWQQALAAAGFASLFVDFPGTGGWTEGELADNTLKRRAEWSEDALLYLQRQHQTASLVVI